MDEKELEELMNSELPNEPEVIPKTRTPISRGNVSESESRKRREAMGRLLMSGMSNDAIFELMSKKTNEDGSPGFNMTEYAVKNLIKEVHAEWKEEDSERKPHSKAASERRILREIMQAKQDKAWTAVSSMEKVLSQIQGTSEPIEINSTTDSRINDALLHLLGEEDPRRIRELIENERIALKSEKEPIAVLPDGNEVYDE